MPLTSKVDTIRRPTVARPSGPGGSKRPGGPTRPGGSRPGGSTRPPGAALPGGKGINLSEKGKQLGKKLATPQALQDAQNTVSSFKNTANNLKAATDFNNLAKGGGKKLANAAINAGISKVGDAAIPVTAGLSKPVAAWVEKHKKETLYIIAAILLVMFLPTLFLIYLFFGGNAAYNQQQQQQAAQGQTTTPLQITKTGPTQAKKGDLLSYTITATFSGSATEIIITDPIPKGTTYSSSTQNGVLSPDKSKVTWDIKNPNSATFVPLVVVLTALKDNTTIVNVASGQLIGAGGINPNATTFDALMTGQGRLTNVLGGENQFVAAVIKNAGTKLSLTGKEAQLHAIYKAAIASNVNPLIVVTIWGVEAGWNTNGTEFGCKPFGSGFNTQLTCSVNTLNHWMSYFEQQKTKPVVIPPIPPSTAYCPYTDPFIFAYEKYTPICAINDNNSNARTNFVNYYRTLAGL